MVLVRLFFALSFVGCIKPGPPRQAPSSADMACSVTLGTAKRSHGQPIPGDLGQLLTELLAQRRLNHQAVQAPDDFAARRSTQHRLGWLAAHNGGAPLLLLLELSARRYDNLGGRFRWVVDVQLSLAAQSDPAGAQTTRFAIPVHLRHAHEDATAAVSASLPTLRRRLAAALDSHLAGAASQ
jgi:hypothetical protein